MPHYIIMDLNHAYTIHQVEPYKSALVWLFCSIHMHTHAGISLRDAISGWVESGLVQVRQVASSD